MRGIVLAGGTGSRLWPATRTLSKQLLPVYDKPMIYYPISTLMLADVQEILIITTPEDASSFKQLLGDGSEYGVKFEYAEQVKPQGLAQAFIIAEEFLQDESCLMVLGDNIFYGSGLGRQLTDKLPLTGAHIFTYPVADPTQYGILTEDSTGRPISVIEKPEVSQSNLAITGLYFFDNRVIEIAKNVRPSSRGELEITSVIDEYLKSGTLTSTKLTRGIAWLDTGTPKSLQEASTYISVIEERTGLKIACLEEIALMKGWISQVHLRNTISKIGNNGYATYLKNLI